MSEIEANFDKEFKAVNVTCRIQENPLARFIEQSLSSITTEELQELCNRRADSLRKLGRNYTKKGVVWSNEESWWVLDCQRYHEQQFALEFRNCMTVFTNPNHSETYTIHNDLVYDLCYIYNIGRVKLGVRYNFDKCGIGQRDYICTCYCIGNPQSIMTTYLDYSEDNLIQRMFNDLITVEKIEYNIY